MSAPFIQEPSLRILEKGPADDFEQKSIVVSQLCDPQWVKASASTRRQAGLPEAGPLELLRVYGVADGLTEEKELPAKDGRPARKTFGLKGKFECANMMSGEVVTGNEYYLPDGFHDRRLQEMKELMAKSRGSSAELEISHLWTAFETKSPAGYAWRLRDLVPPKQTDRMAKLRQKTLGFTTKPLLTLDANNAASVEPFAIEEKAGVPTIEGSSAAAE